MTPYGRREAWEDNPEGWPEPAQVDSPIGGHGAQICWYSALRRRRRRHLGPDQPAHAAVDPPRRDSCGRPSAATATTTNAASIDQRLGVVGHRLGDEHLGAGDPDADEDVVLADAAPSRALRADRDGAIREYRSEQVRKRRRLRQDELLGCVRAALTTLPLR